MDVLNSLIFGFQVAMTPENLLFCFLGCLWGTLIGVLPGIGPSAGISVLLPLTLGLSPTTALITLSAIYYGVMYGGTTTSVLLNIPGEASSVVTCLDGYQLARKGRAAPVLGMAAFGSFIAGTFGILMLTVLAVPIVNTALAFGPPEYFAVAILGLTLVSSLGGESLIKGLLCGAFGLFFSCIGTDVYSGASRFTYGQIYLIDGVGLINVAVGLFALSEIMVNVEETGKQVFAQFKVRVRDVLPTLQDWKDSAGAIARGSFLGFFLGCLPGCGAIISSFLAYGIEKKVSKHPEKFGTGVMEGVAAPESANNAAAQGAFVPLLTLGIPGTPTTAILLGALIIHGVRPGPFLIQSNPDLFWGLIASMYIGNVMLVILNLPLVSIWTTLLKVPYTAIMPLVVLLSCVGVYATENNTFDLWMMIFFGIIGYLARKFDYPLAPMILAMVLGPLMEATLQQSLVLSGGSLSIFFTRPISASVMTLALFSAFAPFLMKRFRKKALREAIAEGQNDL
jgi:putative tricarboxylic transport membrane protein